MRYSALPVEIPKGDYLVWGESHPANHMEERIVGDIPVVLHLVCVFYNALKRIILERVSELSYS